MFKKIILYLKNIYNSSPDYSSPHGVLYKRILKSSYNQRFYKELMVPDTLDGRFDLIILHIFIFIKVYKNSNESNKNFTQKLFDVFMREVESSYRELGISDQTFSKKMKVVIESFYGRTKMYDLYYDDENEFSNCLIRNIWSGDLSKEIFSKQLYSFVVEKVEKYNNKSINQILEISLDDF
ncbi:MAG: hypothetical protein CBD28_002445 [Rhizobiales bacterium TMED168]|nr:MAG: hypothetical protein CBD28_002445 [Rhizobiales bacterium TMED168]|tara:strand:- start:20367 stop:20909 length:543 start_codon:yes stop_codon:yes gene_type:complete